ncbi:helix-turn-helix domain-containing protein [Allohahella marinimesophila]|uniref:Helix-turn-helix domain-containing protein n=1 Tax=Allohahella marinimesophila TaxID=1054972 RepID=A0ABP7NUR8_9GAMM
MTKMVKKANPKSSAAAQAVETNEKKWGKTLMAAGWTAFPNIILEKQQTLGLDAVDMNIILYLSTYWWEADNKPFPSKRTIAEAIGLAPRTVQRRIAALEGHGLIRREFRPDKDKGNKSNRYHFDGLIAEVEGFAQEKVESIEARRSAEAARKRSRKRPQLKGIRGGKQA